MYIHWCKLTRSANNETACAEEPTSKSDNTSLVTAMQPRTSTSTEADIYGQLRLQQLNIHCRPNSLQNINIKIINTLTNKYKQEHDRPKKSYYSY